MSTSYTNKSVQNHFDFNPLTTQVSAVQLYGLSYGGSMHAFLEAKQCYDRVVLYENMCAKPEKELQRILALLNKDTEQNRKLALAALEVDSQQEIFAKRGKLFSLSEEDWTEIDGIFIKLGLKLSAKMSLEDFKSTF